METARLVLREWRPDDVDPHATMAADPEVMRFIGGPLSREQSWRRVAGHAGHWTLRGYGNWAVERRADGAFLGRAGLWNPEGWPGLEVGWTLARHAWGASYASPIAADIHGRSCCLVFAGGESRPPTGGLLCIDLANGAVLTATPHRPAPAG